MPTENSDSKTENIRTVYNQLCESYRAIDDLRLKLLAALPLASGTGIFLLIGKAELQSGFLLPIGLFGFVASLGLFILEIYGIRKCSHLIVLGAFLEKELGIEGQFKHRPRGVEHFRLVPAGIAPLISEPFASGIIYPAVLAVWAFVALYNPRAGVTAGVPGSKVAATTPAEVVASSPTANAPPEPFKTNPSATATAGVVGAAIFVAGFLISLGYSRWLKDKDAPKKESQLTDTAALAELACRMAEAERLGNETLFETLLAEKVTFRRAKGDVVNKEQFLAGLRNSANSYERLESKNIAVQVYEGVAVVTLLVDAKGMREGKAFEGVYRNIRIFLKEPSVTPGWQLHSWFNVKVP